MPRSVANVLDDYASRNAARVVIGRCVTFAIIFGWLWVNYGREVAELELVTMMLVVANGIWSYFWQRRRPADWWVPYLVVLLDCLLLMMTLYQPGRTYPSEWPWTMALRQPVDAYYLIPLGLALLSFQVRLILWTRFCILAAWISIHLLILQEPLVRVSGDQSNTQIPITLALDVNFINLDSLAVRSFVLIMLTGLMAIAAFRLRQLLFSLAEKTRERSNLARYLSPALVDQLAQSDNPLGPPRQVEATVLFADIIGFTAMSETLGPAATMELLRSFHRDMADAVFANEGTLDKFIGDGLMATFGAIENQHKTLAEARAVACALEMQVKIKRWNAQRANEALPPVKIGIGLHNGPVTIGDIGHANRLEFAVIGDTVNLASRIEGLTRELNQPILASDTVATKLGIPKQWQSLGQHRPHGRQGQIGLWAVSAAAT